MFFSKSISKSGAVFFFAASVQLSTAVMNAQAAEQRFPAKPIRLITGGAGGGADFAARVISQKLTEYLGQSVVVDNRGGANGIIAAETVAKAAPDGYTLLLYSGTLWILPYLQTNVPYDPIRDFSPIVQPVSSPVLLAVHPSLPVATLKDLIALAKSKPGKLNFGSGGSGTTPHLAAELFKEMADVNIVGVSYKGTAPAVTAAATNEVQIIFANAAAIAPYLKGSRLNALAVTSLRPSALFPTLPTVASSGLPGFELNQTIGIFAPAKTPYAIISRLNQAIQKGLGAEDAKQKFLNTGVEIVGGSPEELTRTMKSEMLRLGGVIKKLGIHAE